MEEALGGNECFAPMLLWVVAPVCSARVSKVPQPCQVSAGACRGEAFILCALQCSTGILHWSRREKSCSTSPSTAFPVLLPVPWEEVGAIPTAQEGSYSPRASREGDEESELSFLNCLRAGYSGYSSVN